MKPIWLTLVLLSAVAAAQTGARRQGMIVRMHMAPCMTAPHAWMATLAGSPHQQSDELCPEYTLVTDTVVYVIVGKASNQIIPLAERTVFRLQKNELLIRIDDAKNESRFLIKEMVLRPEWENYEQQMAQTAAARPRLPSPLIVPQTQ
jgi:hypothetical protein